jgi:putative endonuclease
MLFYAYVIYSKTHNRFYKGHCSNLEKRLQQHNAGQTKSIRLFIPFELVYFEEFESRQEAVLREKYFKTAAGRKFIKMKLKL